MSSNRVVAIIPARGGSKGIPKKNLKPVGSYSLLARAIKTSMASKLIDLVVVTTDDDNIKEEAEAFGAIVVNRPKELSEDGSSSESALIHALAELESQKINPEVVVFIQATSPFIQPEDLDSSVERVLSGEGDVCFSAFETYAFLWKDGVSGAEGVNHDHRFRPRRQDREPHFQETGAFYVMRAKGFLEAGYRFFGKVLTQRVSEVSGLEIDNLEQLEIARALAHLFPVVQIKPGSIKALVMDFDGVHTDDSALVHSDGTESVKVSRSDGMGIQMLKKAGIPMLILSKETNKIVAVRAEKLGVEVLHGVDDKLPVLIKWCKDKGIDLGNVCYIGNDVNDLECIEAVGWPATPRDANPAAVSRAAITVSKDGGSGAVREICEMILAQLPEGKKD
jgi:YrbI family 3-deoxy-D-manno-octulosonate 8-phosphate phosphatase